MSEPATRRSVARTGVSDPDVIAAIAAGEIAALATLYDRHSDAVLAFASRMTGGNADAEDVVQQTFLVVVNAAGSFDRRSRARPWLLGIAARLLLHRRRAFARFQRLLEAELLRSPTSHDGARAAAAHVELDDVGHALMKLTDAKRVVLLLIEVEQLTGEEVAHELGIPVGTVWTRLHHARRELRRLLEEGGR